MAFDQHTNFAISSVTTAPSPASSGTSLIVYTGTGILFPVTPFNAVVWPSGVNPTSTNAEIVRVTNISTDTFTIVRVQEGSSARSILIGDQIAVAITAKTLTDVEYAIPGVSGTTNYIPKFTATNTIGNSALVDNGTQIYTTTQNFGIGTTNPTVEFQVNSGTSAVLVTSAGKVGLGPYIEGGTFPTETLDIATAQDTTAIAIRQNNANLYGMDLGLSTASGAGTIWMVANGVKTQVFSVTRANQAMNLSPGDLTITQNSVVPFTSISAGAVANTLYLKTGNVGIGTTSPTSKLQVVGLADYANNAAAVAAGLTAGALYHITGTDTVGIVH